MSRKKSCSCCSFYSFTHDRCFEPTTWTHGEFFRIPGDPVLLNPHGKCRLFESVHPVGLDMLRFRVSQFFRRITKRGLK